MPIGDEKELKKDLSAKLSTMGSEQEERLARHRADTLHLPYINLSVFPIDPDVLEKLPKSLAMEAQVVVFHQQGRDIRMGVVNPKLPAVAEAVKHVHETFNAEPQTFVISHRSFRTAVSRYRREQTAAGEPEGEFSVSEEQLGGFEKAIEDMKKLGQHIATMPPSEILAAIVSGAVTAAASDLHVEPGEQEARLRYRIDGVLQDITSFPLSAWRLLVSRVKVLSKLKLNVREVPQDGSFVLRAGEDTYDIRVSMLPGGNGENIVLRLLNRRSEAVKVVELGMKQRDYDVMMEQLKRSDGMVLVTGPTGSGKTTSLASFLQEINSPDVKIITLEDPIEYRLKGVEQTQVDHAAGYTFAKGLRAILRQDPDVIMVGEIRDSETAETALHAALTGHLVFSTLHTNDAPGAVPRLIDMNMKPFILGPAINVIIAQRLVRVVCEKCAEKYEADPQIINHLKEAMAGVAKSVFDPAVLDKGNINLRRAKGCPACNGTGYKGRVGAFEIMPVEGEVEELILQGADGARIREAAQRTGMTTIAQDGYLKAMAGTTTVEEVERITGE